MAASAARRLDVAIIGAGPGGLIAAHAISNAAPQLKVAVFERALVLQRRGAGLGLDINGQKALAAINTELFRAVLDQGHSFTNFQNLAPDASVVSKGTSADFRTVSQTYNQQGEYKVPCLMGWYELQQTLLDKLPAGVEVHLGAELDSLQEDAADGSVSMRFSSSSSQAAVSAALVVASDGYFSRIRRQVVADGLPEYAGVLMWRARLPADRVVGVLNGSDQPDTCTMVFGGGAIWLSYAIGDGREMVWTVSATDARLKEVGLDAHSILPQLNCGSSNQQQQKGTPAAAAAADDISSNSAELSGVGDALQQLKKRGEAARARCKAALQGWNPVFQQLLDDTPPEQIVEHGLFVRPADAMVAAAYGTGRVVVLGDAAHPLRPTGQGLNVTVEDCHALGAALAGCPSGASIDLGAVQKFREVRAARVAPIVAHTSGQAAAAYKRRAPGPSPVTTQQATDQSPKEASGTKGPAASDSAATAAGGKEGGGANSNQASAMDESSDVMSVEEWYRFLYVPDWAPLSAA